MLRRPLARRARAGRALRRSLAVGIAAACLAALPLPAAMAAPVETLTPGVLRVCVYPGFAPFVTQGPNGWAGWDVSYLQAFADRAGLTLEPVPVRDYRDIWMRPGRGECDIAATGITRTAARVQQAGPSATWSATYTNVARALIVRKGTVLRGVRDLAGRTVVTTKGSTADVDLLARLRQAGVRANVRYVASEEEGAREVARGGSHAPIAYAGGAGSIAFLAGQFPDLRTTWVHCLMLPGGTRTSEPFSFVTRTASAGLADALDAFIGTSGVPYPGGPGTGRDCPRSAR